MTPADYLNQMHRLARARDLAGVLALTDEHLTDAMLDAMTPHERRRVHSVIHVAELATGGGALDPPKGIPMDDLEDEDLAAAATNDSAAPSELPDRLGTRRLAPSARRSAVDEGMIERLDTLDTLHPEKVS